MHSCAAASVESKMATMQYKIFCVGEFIKTESATALQRAANCLARVEYNQLELTSCLSLVIIFKQRLTKLSPSF